VSRFRIDGAPEVLEDSAWRLERPAEFVEDVCALSRDDGSARGPSGG
jgi:hypothetical protein